MSFEVIAKCLKVIVKEKIPYHYAQPGRFWTAAQKKQKRHLHLISEEKTGYFWTPISSVAFLRLCRAMSMSLSSCFSSSSNSTICACNRFAYSVISLDPLSGRPPLYNKSVWMVAVGKLRGQETTYTSKATYLLTSIEYCFWSVFQPAAPLPVHSLCHKFSSSGELWGNLQPKKSKRWLKPSPSLLILKKSTYAPLSNPECHPVIPRGAGQILW